MNRRALVVLVVVSTIAVGAAVALRSGPPSGGPGEEAASATAPRPSIPTTAGRSAGGGDESVSPCDEYAPSRVAGFVAASDLVELSGLAASRRSPDLLWGHNDSRGDAEVFALGLDGSDRGVVRLEGTLAFDWEDIAAGPGPTRGEPWLYVGDIGDNFAIRDGVVTVYAFPEPDPGASVVTDPRILELRIPDGPVDAETLLVDPIDGALYVVTKEPDRARVYRAGPAEESPREAVLVATVLLDDPVTAGDVRSDGAVVALRGYRRLWMWRRSPGTALAEAFRRPPCELPITDEVQGEAFAFFATGYATSSEGRHPPLAVARLRGHP